MSIYRRPPSLADDTLRLLDNVTPLRASWADSAVSASSAGEKGGNEAQHMREFIADGGSLMGLVPKTL